MFAEKIRLSKKMLIPVAVCVPLLIIILYVVTNNSKSDIPREALNNLTVSASILPKRVNFSGIGQILRHFYHFSSFCALFPEKRAQLSSGRPQ